MSTGALIGIIVGGAVARAGRHRRGRRRSREPKAQKVCGGCRRVMLPVWTKCLFCGWAPVARLEFILGPMANQTLPLADEVTTIGSVAGNTVVLADPAVSRKHAGDPQGRRRLRAGRPRLDERRLRQRPQGPEEDPRARATSFASATPRPCSSASRPESPGAVEIRRGVTGARRASTRYHFVSPNGTPHVPGQPGPRGNGRAVADRDRLRRPWSRMRDPHRRRHGVAPSLRRSEWRTGDSSSRISAARTARTSTTCASRSRRSVTPTSIQCGSLVIRFIDEGGVNVVPQQLSRRRWRRRPPRRAARWCSSATTRRRFRKGRDRHRAAWRWSTWISASARRRLRRRSTRLRSARHARRTGWPVRCATDLRHRTDGIRRSAPRSRRCVPERPRRGSRVGRPQVRAALVRVSDRLVVRRRTGWCAESAVRGSAGTPRRWCRRRQWRVR